jgi:hypothetical protein
MAKAYNLAPDVAASAVANTLKSNPTWWSRGDFKYPAMAYLADSLGAVGGLKLPIDWKAVVDERFLPPGLKATQ